MSIREYFSFTKRERAGILALLCILSIVGFLPYVLPHPSPVAGPVPIDHFEKRRPPADSAVSVLIRSPDNSPRKQSYPKRTYPRSEYYHYPPRSRTAPSFTPYRREVRKYVAVDINTADTTAFIALPGIGSKLANRIIAFRAKLGGFDSIGRIREVYGLRDSVYQKLLPYLKCDSMYAPIARRSGV